MARWMTFWGLHNGMNDLRKAGIRQPEDLLRLPSDSDGEDMPSDEEALEFQREMDAINAAARKKETG